MAALLWHPARANPLDYIQHDLVDRNGNQVTLEQRMNGDFIVTINNYPVNTGSNINTCAYLNEHGVGEK